jgi:hypothetical protein
VQNLLPFQPIESKVIVKSNLIRSGDQFTLIFSIDDSKKVLNLPSSFVKKGDLFLRQDGLWNDTCFEMFLMPAGAHGYYEFNFSYSAWNVYKFTDYRTPQPPAASLDFTLQHVQWDQKILQIKFESKKQIGSAAVGITAVLKEASGQKHHMAIAHKGEKPDFHLADSFILKI